MRTPAADVVAFYRMFAMMERDQVCCGTVTVAQCAVLQTLLEGTWDASALASHARVTKGAMTRLLDGLESRGFVERHQDPDDGRRWLIELTATGTKEAKRLAGITENAVALIMSRIPKDMRKPAVAMIAELRKAAEQVRDQIDCC
ncbi:MAG: MarR family transcriptional regulator [Gammaproteobacteria bacterium]|nr:MarR family transcriptional regulator [Gammaproteobacteria bacterium]MBT8109320.1 MarR family transcriptional regulator [Gammaproteobacteria bacterium]NNL44022.1 MarR family transcriptional regulator [Woeseiaceae bacterium]